MQRHLALSLAFREISEDFLDIARNTAVEHGGGFFEGREERPSSRSTRRRVSPAWSEERAGGVMVFLSSSSVWPRSTPRATFSVISSMYPRNWASTDLPSWIEPCPGITRSNSRASSARKVAGHSSGKPSPMYGNRPCIRSPVAITRSEGMKATTSPAVWARPRKRRWISRPPRWMTSRRSKVIVGRVTRGGVISF